MSQVPTKVLRNVRSAASFNQNQHEQNTMNLRPSSMERKNQVELKYSDVPYLQTRNFAVYVPTNESVEKLYKSASIKPQYKNIYTAFQPVHQNPEDVMLLPNQEKAVSHVPQTAASRSSRTSLPQTKAQLNGTLTKKNIELMNQIQEKQKNQGNVLNKLKSYKTNSTVAILQGLPLKEKQTLDTNEKQNKMEMNTLQEKSMTRTVTYSGIPWIQFDTDKQYNDPFSQRNHIRTMAAFRQSGKKLTINDVMLMSKSITSTINDQLKQQTDKRFLFENKLNPLPKQLQNPLTRCASQGRRFLIAENDAHCRETNFGYSRKANGTFYNH